jgi:hypothetical protein
MVLNVDDPIPEAALNEILQIPDVWTAYVVSLPESGDNPMAAGSAPSGAVAHTRLR